MIFDNLEISGSVHSTELTLQSCKAKYREPMLIFVGTQIDSDYLGRIIFRQREKGAAAANVK